MHCACFSIYVPKPFTTLIFNHNKKVEYTDFSRQNRLRLEDSFLPGALQNPCMVTFRGASYRLLHKSANVGKIMSKNHNSGLIIDAAPCNSTRIREMTPIPKHNLNTSQNEFD
jgi:hypothetical protein